MQADDPARAALAESAACGLPVLPQLRLLTVAEALSAPPPRRALELNAELDTLCTALRQGVRRRSGWLYFVPATRPLPAAVPRGLLQAAMLCFADGVLALPDGQAAVQLEAAPHAAVLVLRGGLGRTLPADTRALLLRLAAICGGAVVQSGGSGPFTAALRLPVRPGLPLCEAPAPDSLLCDRYSALQVFLPGACISPQA